MSSSPVRVARVLYEDEGYVTLEICKTDGFWRKAANDRYWTLVFVRQTERPGEMAAWFPWAPDEDFEQHDEEEST